MTQDTDQNMRTDRNLLRMLIQGKDIGTAPIKSVRHDHVEVLVAIGKDHTASIVMPREAMDLLLAASPELS